MTIIELFLIGIGIGIIGGFINSKISRYFAKKIQKMTAKELLGNMVLFLGFYVVAFCSIATILLYFNLTNSILSFIFISLSMLVLLYFIALLYYAKKS